METIRFMEEYSDPKNQINKKAPEIRFMERICKSGTDVENYFVEKTIYRDIVYLDAPNGRYEGLLNIKAFAGKWLKDFQASEGEVHPVIQTVANGLLLRKWRFGSKLRMGTQKGYR